MRNRFEVAPQALILSAGVIMSIVLISIMVSQFERARNMSSVVTQKMMNTTADIANSDILQYDGVVITGADVRNFYRRYYTASGSEAGTMTVNNGQISSSYTSSGSYGRMTDPSDRAYIRPDDLYKCSVTVNANGIITGTGFVKK
ncbi:MAG: hypothetical protein J6Y89_05965 [Lachnospiraceae bacterium]|nr:hypothetical protein [Lachnospiraceae bacterium]